VSEERPVPAELQKRRDSLTERLALLDGQIAVLQRKQDESDEEAAYSELLGSLLRQSADTVDHLHDSYRETVVLLYEQQERDKAEGGFDRKPREGQIVVALDAPAGLETKSIEEMLYVLRTKQSWTWQQIVDWLVSKGVKRPKGGSDWHTSAAYAIHKKGFSPTRAAACCIPGGHR
jgi:hypothetical protein